MVLPIFIQKVYKVLPYDFILGSKSIQTHSDARLKNKRYSIQQIIPQGYMTYKAYGGLELWEMQNSIYSGLQKSERFTIHLT